MKHVLILCNALDDATRVERGIVTDSPAASNKIFALAAALRAVGVRTSIVSFGRGRWSLTGTAFAAKVVSRRGVPTAYLRFVTRPLWSEIVTLVAAAIAIVRFHRRGRDEVVIAYNRAPANFLAIVTARLLGMRVVLDLEDGFSGTGGGLRHLAIRCGNGLVDRLCDRAMLACTALAAATPLRPILPYYGVVEAVVAPRVFSLPMHALLGGTLEPNTGAEWLADTIEQLRRDRPSWAADLIITITGKGSSQARLAALAGEDVPQVRVPGRTSDAEYAAIRAKTTIGLSLRPSDGGIADTTFPSKTIEMAAAGQIIVTTDVSDVRAVLGDDGAVYLRNNSVAALVDSLRWVVEHREAAALIAARGTAAVARRCDPSIAASEVARFLFGGRPADAP